MEERVDMGTHILREAPTARRLADERGWWLPGGGVDWTRVEVDLTEMEHLSGGERRLIGSAALLHAVNEWMWGFDAVNGAVVADALRSAADWCAEEADTAEGLSHLLNPEKEEGL